MAQQEYTLRSAYKRLWTDWLRRYRWQLALTFVFMLLIAICSAGYAKFMESVISAFKNRVFSVMYWGPLGVILLTLVKGLSQYAQEIILVKILSRMQVRMQDQMFNNLVHMDLSTLMNEAPSALAARFSADIELIRMAVRSVIGTLTAVLTVIASFIVMLSIDWAMTLGLIAIFALAFGPVGIIGARVRRIAAQTQQEIASMTATVNEGLSGIRMIRTYQLENRVEKAAHGIFEKLFSLRVALVKWQATVSPMMEILGGLAIAALLFLVGWRMASGAIDLGGFVGLLTALAVATAPARKLGAGFTIASQGMAALERVFALYDTPQNISDGSKSLPEHRAAGHLEFRDVGFAYPNGTVALTDINLEIAGGKTYAFVGPSGSGKTTVFNLIPRLYDVTDGSVLLDGLDIRDLKLSELRRQISVVGQESVLLKGTIMENIRFGRQEASDQECILAAKDAAAHEFIEGLPDGYATMVEPSDSKLSGGQKQRLSIARAILRDAPILLLDEPTSALDAGSEAAIRETLDKLSVGRTTLIIAHRLATIMDADQIVVLDDGKVVDQGKHQELLNRGGIYSELYRLQFSQGE